MVLADKECPYLFFSRVSGYISAECCIWWDLALGHLFPAGLPDGTRGGRSVIRAAHGHCATRELARGWAAQ